MEKIILAADIGGTTCKLGIFDEQLERIEKWSIKTDTSDVTGYALLENVYESFVEHVDNSEFAFSDVLGVGIG
ncbi:glucokinase, partial [Staphylococcus epidermidis]